MAPERVPSDKTTHCEDLTMKLFKATFIAITVLASSFALSLDVGDKLIPLSFTALPSDFEFVENNKMQLITVFPAKPSSAAAGKFNAKLIKKGFCPIAVTDMDNKAWYAPNALVVDSVMENFNSDAHNPECPVSIDETGLIRATWGLTQEITSIVVDRQGAVVFYAEGLLDLSDEIEIMMLLDLDS